MKRNLHHPRLLLLFVLGVIEFSFLLLLAPSAHANPASSRVQASRGDAAAPSALLQFTSGGHVLGFQVGEFYVSNATFALRIEFVDANPVAPTSDAALQSDSARRGAPPLTRVTYLNLWDGITLAYDGTRGGVVSSSYGVEVGADPRAIRLRYNAPVTLNEGGTLRIAYATGELIESAPLAWQEVEGERVPVSAAFVQLGEREIGFALGEYDAERPLFIDPTLTWNTFLGGSGADGATAIAVDGSGNVYIAGTSNAGWGSPNRGYTSGYDAFAAKLNASGALAWNTFLGGVGEDRGNAIGVDGSGNVYVAGYSTGTWGTPLGGFSLYSDYFVAKLSPSGALIWNTFGGGLGYESANAVAVDGGGNVYVAGARGLNWCWPEDYPCTKILVAKLSASGALIWVTELGSNRNHTGRAIAIDAGGNIYVAGDSDATWQGTSPPVRAFSGIEDAFVAKLSSSGALIWNTFLGGSGYDYGGAIAVDGSGNVYVAGESDATWQGASSPIRPHAGGHDAFAAKLSPSGSLTWNTFLGGGGDDYGYGIVVDGSGSAYVAGCSNASWQGTSAPLRAYTSGDDGFAAKLNPSGALAWNAFLGGSGGDCGMAIAARSGSTYVAGSSWGSWGSPVRTYSGNGDAFVAKIDPFGLYLPLTIK